MRRFFSLGASALAREIAYGARLGVRLAVALMFVWSVWSISKNIFGLDMRIPVDTRIEYEIKIKTTDEQSPQQEVKEDEYYL